MYRLFILLVLFKFSTSEVLPTPIITDTFTHFSSPGLYNITQVTTTFTARLDFIQYLSQNNYRVDIQFNDPPENDEKFQAMLLYRIKTPPEIKFNDSKVEYIADQIDYDGYFTSKLYTSFYFQRKNQTIFLVQYIFGANGNQPVFVTVALPFTQNVSYSLKISQYTVYECLNSCSGHGSCELDSSCSCQDGYLGADCSIKSTRLSRLNPTSIISSEQYKFLYFQPEIYDNQDYKVQIELKSPGVIQLATKYESYDYEGLPTEQNNENLVIVEQSQELVLLSWKLQIDNTRRNRQKFLISIRTMSDSPNREIKTMISLNPKTNRQSDDDYQTTILIVSLTSFLFICFSCLIAVISYLRWRQYCIERSRFKMIENLMPKTQFEQLSESDRYIHNCCSICLNDYKSQDTLRSTLCGHYFHAICLDGWVLKAFNCPICRQGLNQPQSTKHTKQEELEKEIQQVQNNEDIQNRSRVFSIEQDAIEII